MALTDADQREVNRAKHNIANWEAIIEGYESQLCKEADEDERRKIERRIKEMENKIDGLRSEIRYTYGITI